MTQLHRISSPRHRARPEGGRVVAPALGGGSGAIRIAGDREMLA